VTTRRHVPRKRFGQHFWSTETSSSASSPQSTRTGASTSSKSPGLGALTTPLLDRVEHLHVVELDRDLSGRLRERYPVDRMTVHQADALRFDFCKCSLRLLES